MSALERRPEGLKMSELSRMLMVSNGNVTGIVDRLVEEGLALRAEVAGDRRATLVRLTEAGARQFAAMAAEHARWVDALMAGLDEAEVEQTAAALAKLARTAR
jgi:DNA-binding MarR family transcriptional regulator